MFNNTYNFTPYKQKLISKGKNKYPRIISIPTIRDKLTLGILKDIIYVSFQEDINHKLVQTIIGNIEEILNNKNNYYIKMDIKRFYNSIDHDILMKRVRKKIRKKEILNLIEKAITNPTIAENALRKRQRKNLKGVPQGIPISNILASVYLNNFDRNHKKNRDYDFFRYVDDILILCKEENWGKIYLKIKDEIESRKLEIHTKEKLSHGKIKDGFSYLGYYIEGNKFYVRESSIRKLEHSIEKLFVDFSHSGFNNLEYFLWKLNLKITGCINNNEKFGWLFFFSQVTELEQLFHLDWLIQKFIKRFELENKIGKNKIKRFVRTYHELRKNLDKTNYIPHFSDYNIDDKKEFLKKIVKINTKNLDNEQINKRFNRTIYSSIKKLEKDIQEFS